MSCLTLLLALVLPISVYGLDNGLALKPPMGWLSWTRFTCNIDCKNEPADCISERLYRDMADRLVADGYKALGYEYVNIDDCWMEKQRDKDGKLVPDKERFPNGIKGLADYVHSKGLKLGIYQDVGNMTCAQYPGSYGNFEKDAATFAEWEVDMVKVDGCFADVKEMEVTYPAYSVEVNKTTRPIVFSCEWPFYMEQAGMVPDYKGAAKYCNVWRNYHDIDDSWKNVLDIIDYFAKNQDDIAAATGPGSWNDPDMIIAGNFGLSYDQARAQMILWAIWASPLLMSNDLRDIKKEFSDLLKNKEIIAVNQDPLGIMGKRVHKEDDMEVWIRQISPVTKGKYSYAIAFLNRKVLGGSVSFSITLNSTGLDNVDCYTAYDVFTPGKTTKLCPKDVLTSRVNPSSANMIVVKNYQSAAMSTVLNSTTGLITIFISFILTTILKR